MEALIIPALGTSAVLAATVLVLVWDRRCRRHVAALADLSPRILVTGTRGKSSTVRLLHAVLRAADRAPWGRVTGTVAEELAPTGATEPVVRTGQHSVLELFATVRRARAAGARSLVVECMAVNPELIALTQRFLTDPAANAFFVEPVWGKPDSQGVWEGQLDRTCLSGDGGKGLQKWCRWLAYNMPGPEGVNPFPKIPRKSDGSYAPVLIGQGMDDTLIYCQHPDPTVPPARDCMSRQLYDAFRSHRGMCRTTNLQLDLFAATPSSPASHLSTMYQLADNGKAGYVGSPMDDFLSAAFAGKVTAGCSAEVLNR